MLASLLDSGRKRTRGVHLDSQSLIPKPTKWHFRSCRASHFVGTTRTHGFKDVRASVHKHRDMKNCVFPNVHGSLTSTLHESSGMRWNAVCEPDLITHHQGRTSLRLLWLNGSKSPQTRVQTGKQRVNLEGWRMLEQQSDDHCAGITGYVLIWASLLSTFVLPSYFVWSLYMKASVHLNSLWCSGGDGAGAPLTNGSWIN